MKSNITEFHIWITYSNYSKNHPICSQIELQKIIDEADNLVSFVKSEENNTLLCVDFFKGLFNFHISKVNLSASSKSKYFELLKLIFNDFTDNQKNEILNLVINLNFEWEDLDSELKDIILEHYSDKLKAAKSNKQLENILDEFDPIKLEQLKAEKLEQVNNIFLLTKSLIDLNLSFDELSDQIKHKYRCFTAMYIFPGIKFGVGISQLVVLDKLNKYNLESIYLEDKVKENIMDAIFKNIFSLLNKNINQINYENIIMFLELSSKILSFNSGEDFCEFNNVIESISDILEVLHQNSSGISAKNHNKIIDVLHEVNTKFRNFEIPNEKSNFVETAKKIHKQLCDLREQYKFYVASQNAPNEDRISWQRRMRK